MSTGELSESLHLVEMLAHTACDLSLLAFPWQPYLHGFPRCLNELRINTLLATERLWDNRLWNESFVLWHKLQHHACIIVPSEFPPLFVYNACLQVNTRTVDRTN